MKYPFQLNQETVEAIFEEEASGLGITAAYLSQTSAVLAEVYPQDIVDAVRCMKRQGLLEEGRKVLLASPYLRSMKYNLSLKPHTPSKAEQFQFHV